MVPGQRRQYDIRRDGIDPAHLLQFGGGKHFGFDAQKEDLRLDDPAFLVGGGRAEPAQMFRLGSQFDRQFFLQFAPQRIERRFPRFDLAAGLHESHGAALAYQQGASGGIQDQGGGNADRRSVHGSKLSSPPALARASPTSARKALTAIGKDRPWRT